MLPTVTRHRSTLFAALLAAFVVALALALPSAPAHAQQDDTAFWAFASQDPFFDTRVAEAFAALMDLEAAGDAGGVTLEYGVEGVTFSADADDAPLLLQAAGLMDTDETLLLAEVRSCTVWASNDGLEPVAEALAAELTGALVELGVTVSGCVPTDDADAADLLVWAPDEEPEGFDPFAEGTDGFLTSDPDAGAPDDGATPDDGKDDEAGEGKDDEGDGKAPNGPDPAVGGFGVFTDSDSVIPAWLLAAAAIAGILLAARLATGRIR